jgi:GT2 family glycosyltransferase
MSAPDLSIVIVNWHSRDYLKKCLESVFANRAGLALEVLVIDNASYDGSGGMVARDFPEVRFIQSAENLGFAGANNLAFRHSSGASVLFLNPDTEIIGSALQTMLAVLQSSPDTAIAGPRLLNSDGSVQTSCIQRFPTILNQLLDSEYLRRKFPRAGIWGMRPLWDEPASPVEVEVISGACLMIRRDALEQAGLFSTRYFMYSEDVDLCYEVKRSGQKVHYANAATVIHHGGRSSAVPEETHFASVMPRESVYRYLAATRGKGYAAMFRATTALAAMLRLGLLQLVIGLRLDRNRPARQASAAKWRSILDWSLRRGSLVGDSAERVAGSVRVNQEQEGAR